MLHCICTLQHTMMKSLPLKVLNVLIGVSDILDCSSCVVVGFIFDTDRLDSQIYGQFHMLHLLNS